MPDFDCVVAAARDEAAGGQVLLGAVFAGDAAGESCRRGPGDGVGAGAVCLEDDLLPLVAGEFEHADVAVSAGAGEEAAEVGGRPGDGVD